MKVSSSTAVSARVTVRGLVIPWKWDSEGNVTAVMISAPDEREYLVHMTGKAMDLLRHLHERVQVKGRIMGSEEGKPLLQAEHYWVRKG